MTVLTSTSMSTWAPPPHTVQAVDQDQIHQIPRWARSLPANVPSKKKTRTPLFGTYYFNTETVFFGIRICWNQEITRHLYIWIFFSIHIWIWYLMPIPFHQGFFISCSEKCIPQLRKLPLAQPKNSPEKKKKKNRPTWRIIPLSKWLITMVSKSLTWGYSPSKSPKWLINRGY